MSEEPCQKSRLCKAREARGSTENSKALHTRGEIIIVAIVGPRIEKGFPRVGFDEIVCGERGGRE